MRLVLDRCADGLVLVEVADRPSDECARRWQHMTSSVGEGSIEMTHWVHEYINAWNNHDAAAVGQFMAANATYEDLAAGRFHQGREAIEVFVRATEDVSQDFQITLVSHQQNGDQYAFEWEMAGTNTGPGVSFPATHAPYRIRGVSIGRLDENGRIQENRDYWNLASLLMQLGILPAPGNA